MTQNMIITGELKDIDFAPQNAVFEVAQNVRTILTTIQGSVPLDRAFGVNGELVDQPINIARAKLSADIIKKIEKYEPRAKVKKITYSGDTSGTLVPRLEVNINV